MKTTIRLAFENDIDEMVKLLEDLFTQDIEFVPDYQKQKRGLELIVSNPEIGEILVLEVDGQIAGMVSLLYSVSTALGQKVAILEDMIISKQYRSNGLGSELLNHAIQYAKSKKCGRLTLLTDFDNERAIGFYKKAGFNRSDMIPMRLFFLSSIFRLIKL